MARRSQANRTGGSTPGGGQWVPAFRAGPTIIPARHAQGSFQDLRIAAISWVCCLVPRSIRSPWIFCLLGGREGGLHLHAASSAPRTRFPLSVACTARPDSLHARLPKYTSTAADFLGNLDPTLSKRPAVLVAVSFFFLSYVISAQRQSTSNLFHYTYTYRAGPAGVTWCWWWQKPGGAWQRRFKS